MSSVDYNFKVLLPPPRLRLPDPADWKGVMVHKSMGRKIQKKIPVTVIISRPWAPQLFVHDDRPSGTCYGSLPPKPLRKLRQKALNALRQMIKSRQCLEAFEKNRKSRRFKMLVNGKEIADAFDDPTQVFHCANMPAGWKMMQIELNSLTDDAKAIMSKYKTFNGSLPVIPDPTLTDCEFFRWPVKISDLSKAQSQASVVKPTGDESKKPASEKADQNASSKKKTTNKQKNDGWCDKLKHFGKVVSIRRDVTSWRSPYMARTARQLMSAVAGGPWKRFCTKRTHLPRST